METTPGGVCRLVPEITICATLVACRSLTRARVGNGGVRRERADTSPAVATDARPFEDPLAERVRRFAALLGRRRRRRRDRSGLRRCNRRNAAQIDDHGLDVRIVGDLLVTPGADPGAAIGCDIESMPSCRDRAAEFLPIVERNRQIARRVTFAAMRQRLGEISASVPLRTLPRVGLEADDEVDGSRHRGHPH